MPNQRLWPLSSCRRCLPPPPVPSAANTSPQHAIRHLAYHTQQTVCSLSYTMFKRRQYFSLSQRCTDFSAEGGALSSLCWVFNDQGNQSLLLGSALRCSMLYSLLHHVAPARSRATTPFYCVVQPMYDWFSSFCVTRSTVSTAGVVRCRRRRHILPTHAE
jgi:hypothetical protein